MIEAGLVPVPLEMPVGDTRPILPQVLGVFLAAVEVALLLFTRLFRLEPALINAAK